MNRLRQSNNAIDFFKMETHQMDKNLYMPGAGKSTNSSMSNADYERLRRTRSPEKVIDPNDKRAYFRRKYYLKTKSSVQELPSPWEIIPQKHSNFY
jgi:hypothetical protein